ncbi:amino acid permease [Thermocladium modestius]|uniref:Amino acid permease n=1 Tax=Thermocladium modestius TaxID=62609 RepID=A0A830GXF8_9CREN|nr:APC family permease [Thermocladium modestius]GGP21241.1 amino acid permease [Thermocladium modestius]
MPGSEENPGDRKISEAEAEKSDKMLRRALGRWDIAFLVIGAMIGSGWLFGSEGAATAAGPGAILSWIIAGFLMIFVALTFAEIGGMLPKSGGIVRYPQYAYGGFASFILAWSYLLSAVTVAPSEAIAAVTYMSTYIPQLYTSSGITLAGIGVAALLTIFFFLLNWYGVQVMGKTNTGVGWWKLIIPTLTFILLIGLAMHATNFTAMPGGFIPYGAAAIFLAIPTTGIAYSYLGFRQGVDFSGEARKPTDVVWGTILGFIIVMAIYVLLQVSFIGAVDWSKLHILNSQGQVVGPISPGDWADLGKTELASGPFYEIMTLSGVAVLAGFGIILLIDAIVSPSGTGWIYIGTTSRTIYGMAADGHLPSAFLKLNRYKVPLLPMIASLVIGLIFLLPFPTWFAISSFITSTTVFTYVVSGPALMSFRKTIPDAPRPLRLPAASLIAAIASIAAYLIVYWSTFYTLWFVFALVMGGLPLFYMYTMVNRYNVNRTSAAAAGIIYWAILIISTYFLIYKPIIAPTGWPSPTPSTIPLTAGAALDFTIYILITLAMTIGFTLWLSSTTANKDAAKHVRAGWWVVAVIFTSVILSFLGSANYGLVFTTAVIPFPWDVVVAALIALALYFYGTYSGILTDDLMVALKEMGISAAPQ